LDVYGVAEDAPQVAGIIDERPAELKAKELYTSQKWKVVTDPLLGDIQVRHAQKKFLTIAANSLKLFPQIVSLNWFVSMIVLLAGYVYKIYLL